MKIIKLDAIDSTNSYLKKLLNKESLDDLTVVVSKHQTQGRGRNGNVWSNKPSLNLAFSIYKRFSDFEIDKKFMLNVISSISVYETLKKNNLLDLTIKWPNDIMTANKKVTPTLAVHLASGTQINGYEIHIGDTTGNDCAKPFATSNDTPDGAISFSGQVMGTYLHGLFSNNSFRQFFLKNIGAKPSNLDYEQEIENILDELAEHIEKNIDIDTFISIAR